MCSILSRSEGRDAGLFIEYDCDMATNSPKSDNHRQRAAKPFQVSGLTTARRCKPSSGRIEVCNDKYGKNGWLGIAQIWISGDHIMQGIVKVNDTYFSTSKYNTDAWKNLVMCQEVGHTVGLGHVDEDMNNTPLGTCMDYSSDPNPNQHPNNHDYEMLESIYGHLDGSNTWKHYVILSPSSDGGGSRGGLWKSWQRPNSAAASDFLEIDPLDLSKPEQWGEIVKRATDGRSSLHERIINKGKGEKIVTFVVWADGE